MSKRLDEAAVNPPQESPRADADALAEAWLARILRGEPASSADEPVERQAVAS